MSYTRSIASLPWFLVGILLVMGITACARKAPETTSTHAGNTPVPEQTETTEAAPTRPATATPGATRTATATPEITQAETSTPVEIEEETNTVTRPEGWSEETHSKDAEPNYDVVFAQDRVHQITITIDPLDWEAMQANMVALFGQPGSGRENRVAADRAIPPEDGRPQPGEDGAPERTVPPEGNQPVPPEGDRPQAGEDGTPERVVPPEGRNQPVAPEGDRPGGRGLGGGDMTPENPMWVPATITFEGHTWTNVGVRYKGNSSLTSGWRSGSVKLPLKLDFDEFEEDYPEIDNQRFYGFKQLSLANGFHDTSLLRDAVTANILTEAGLPAAATAFYRVILDYGEGPVTLGLYTMIEVIDDTAIARTFGSDDGNIYEAEGSAASFAAPTYDQIEESFQKENNADEGDWSDIEALFEALHAEQRNTDPDTWRSNLESVLDVDGFLEWLAISAVIQHWDTYGSMSHNYYLYHDPATERLVWISWDHNETMPSGTGDRAGRGSGNRIVSLDKADVGDNWPLIRYLLDDPVYYAKYVDYIAQTVAGPFDPDRVAETCRTLAELIAPYAAADVGEAAFHSAVEQLIEYAYQRADTVEVFLSSD